MDLKALNYFVAAYEEGNITAAAKRCHISQPSISAAISGLESNLDIVVFSRHKKGVTPTPDGERLYVSARKLLSDATALKAMFKPDEPSTKLTLGLMPALDIERVTKLLEPINQLFSNLDLRLTKHTETCDARIICKDHTTQHDDFLPLWNESFVLAMPEGHPLVLKDQLFLTDIEKLPLIARDYCGNALINVANATGMELNIAATAFSEEWALALVGAGLGVAILPEGYIKPSHKIIGRKFSNMDIKRQVGIAYDTRTEMSEALQQVLAADIYPG